MMLSIITHGSCFIFGAMAGMLIMCILSANDNDYVDMHEDDCKQQITTNLKKGVVSNGEIK